MPQLAHTVQITRDAHAIQSHAAPILRDATPVWWIYEPKPRLRLKEAHRPQFLQIKPIIKPICRLENLEKCRKVSLNGRVACWSPGVKSGLRGLVLLRCSGRQCDVCPASARVVKGAGLISAATSKRSEVHFLPYVRMHAGKLAEDAGRSL